MIFAHTSGPHDALVVIVGEAWGQQEAMIKRPFIGASGQELSRMLTQVGIDRQQCLLTNVFAFQPQNNSMDSLCAKRSELPKDYSHPPLSQGKYIRPEFLPELARLSNEITAHPRNVVIALGNTACWALLGSAKIGSIRGTITTSTLCPGIKVLPTYHPAAVLRNWSQRPIVVADLMKAKRESGFPELRLPRREIIVAPDLNDIAQWAKANLSTTRMAVDIETGNGLIRCIGFATSPDSALVVPFWDASKPDGSYWSEASSERQAREWCQTLLLSGARKVTQNGAYDLQYLLRDGYRVANWTSDTMLMSHALFPELPKSLGFLGSLYTNEQSWKLLRRQSEVNKKDE